VTRLTNTPDRREQHPNFSPDGTRIVFDDNFHGDPGTNGFIYSMNLDGSDVTQLTNRTDRHGLPSYAPDGTKILFTASEDIWMMDPDGSNQVRLTTTDSAFEIPGQLAADCASPIAPPPTPPPSAPGVSACASPGAAGYLHPAKMRVARSRVDREERELDVFAPITSRARGEVEVTYQGDRRTDTFDAEVTSGDATLDRIRFREPITAGQAELGTGIVTLDYKGDEDTRAEEVRLRAASRRAELDVDQISLIDGRLSARGSVTGRAEGIVGFRYSYIDAAGNPQIYPARATIQDDGDWKLDKRRRS
jgi:dipeptidyl aminopeptidase/acylaminoacyl peptidase